MGQDADGPWLVGALSDFDLSNLLYAPRFLLGVCMPLTQKNESSGSSVMRGCVGYLR